MNTLSHVEDHQLLTSWLACIGMLTMYWSPVERHIDQCVHLLRLQLGAQKKSKLIRLNWKLIFIEQNMPIGIIDAQELDNLIKLTKSSVQIRDVCVHGVLNSYDQEKIEIGKINCKADDHLIENFTIDLNRLNRSASALSTLQLQWGSISSSLLKYGGHV